MNSLKTPQRLRSEACTILIKIECAFEVEVVQSFLKRGHSFNQDKMDKSQLGLIKRAKPMFYTIEKHML